MKLLDKAQKTNYIRWPILGKYVWPNRYVGNSYEDEINYLKQWLEARFSWIDSQFSDTSYSGELQITGDVYKLFSDGNKKNSGSLKGGKKDKLWIEWYENGQRMSEGSYKDGEYVGIWTYYNEDGSVKEVKEY